MAALAAMLAGCSTFVDLEIPAEICAGGEDEDADGLIDCEDPDCVPPVPDRSGRYCLDEIDDQCTDDLDNDGDGAANIMDPQCWGVDISDDLRRIERFRCASSLGTDFDAALDPRELWTGPLAFLPEGLGAPAIGQEFDVRLLESLPGTVRDTRIEATLTTPTAEEWSLSLGVDFVATAFAPPVRVAIRREGDQALIALEVDGDRGNPILTRAFDGALQISLALRTPAPGCLDDEDKEILSARVLIASGSLCLSVPTPPALQTAANTPLQILWSGETRPVDPFVLEALTVQRSGADICGREVPSPAHDSLVEVHSVAARAVPDPEVLVGGPQFDLCGLGAEAGGRLVALPGVLEPSLIDPVAPEWTEPSPVQGSGRFGAIMYDEQADEWLAVTSSQDRSPSQLRVLRGLDCADLGMAGEIELTGFERDVTELAVLALSRDRRLERPWVWLRTDDSLVPCLLDDRRGQCEVQGERGLGQVGLVRNERYWPPNVTLYAVGSTYRWIVAAPNGLVATRNVANAPFEFPLLTPSVGGTTFDRELLSGALFVEPQRRDLTNEPLFGWLVYSARACSESACPRRVSTAWIRFLE